MTTYTEFFSKGYHCSQSTIIQGLYEMLSKGRLTSCILAETQRKTEEWENYKVEKEKSSSRPCLKAITMGKVQVGCLQAGHLMGLVRGEYLTFFIWS